MPILNFFVCLFLLLTLSKVSRMSQLKTRDNAICKNLNNSLCSESIVISYSSYSLFISNVLSFYITNWLV